MTDSSDSWKIQLLYGSLSGVLLFFSYRAARKCIKLRTQLRTQGTRSISYLYDKKYGRGHVSDGPVFRLNRNNLFKMKVFIEGKLTSEQDSLLSVSKNPVLLKLKQKFGLTYFGNYNQANPEQKLEQVPVIHLQDFYTRQQIPIVPDPTILANKISKTTFAINVKNEISWLKSFGYGFLAVLGSLAGNYDFGYKLGYKEQELTIGFNTPVYAYATVLLNKSTGAMHVRLSNYVACTLSHLRFMINTATMISCSFTVVTTGLVLYFSYKLYRQVRRATNPYNSRKVLETMEKKLQELALLDIEDIKCIICFNAVRNLIILPCRHVCLCSMCYDELERKNTTRGKCPICKTDIIRTVHINYV